MKTSYNSLNMKWGSECEWIIVGCSQMRYCFWREGKDYISMVDHLKATSVFFHFVQYTQFVLDYVSSVFY